MAQFRTVCTTSEIPEGTARMIVLDGVMLGIFHINGQFFALDNQCPHEGASLAHGFITGGTVACRIHRWRFRIRDGTYLDEDKPRCNAHSFPVQVVGDEVQVEI